jgi:biotin carboxyl carrier protein
MKYTFIHQGKSHELTLIPTSDGYRVAYQGGEHTLTDIETAPSGVPTPLAVRFRLNGVVHTLPVSADRDTRWVAFDGRMYELKRETRSSRGRPEQELSEGILRAPMPGQVRAVNVQTGDLVTKGQTLLLLEAMKMEIRIQAPSDGTVAKIGVEVGDQVDKEQTLVEIH